MKTPAPIYLAAFISGFVVMVLELSGTRLMGPILGTSVYVWTSIIGVILASLSAGYSLGGRLADRGASVEDLSMLFLYAAVTVGLTPFLGIRFAMYADSSTLDPRLLSTLSSAVVFAVPSVLLGMISPYTARLALRQLDTSGQTVGNVYAVSTLGSILGTFLAGFFLFSYFGVHTLLLALSGSLTLTSIGLAPRDRFVKKMIWVLCLAGFMLLSHTVTFALQARGVTDLDTNYQRVLVTNAKQKDGTTIRSLITDGLGVQGQMIVEKPEDVVFSHIWMYDVARHVSPAPKRILMLGGGTFTYPLHLLRAPGDFSVDVVEIDPGITAIARKHFGLRDDPRMRVIHEDARTFVNHLRDAQYDIVIIDTFNAAPAIPFQMTTKEFVTALHRNVTPDGVVVVNIISALEGKQSLLLHAMAATYRTVFSQVILFRASDNPKSEPQNIELVALKGSEPIEMESTDAEMQKRLDKRWEEDSTDRNGLVLTDDFAPVEGLSLEVAISSRKLIVEKRLSGQGSTNSPGGRPALERESPGQDKRITFKGE